MGGPPPGRAVSLKSLPRHFCGRFFREMDRSIWPRRYRGGSRFGASSQHVDATFRRLGRWPRRPFALGRSGQRRQSLSRPARTPTKFRAFGLPGVPCGGRNLDRNRSLDRSGRATVAPGGKHGERNGGKKCVTCVGTKKPSAVEILRNRRTVPALSCRNNRWRREVEIGRAKGRR